MRGSLSEVAISCACLANPFDFHHHKMADAKLHEETVALATQADRYQCARGIEAVTFGDLLTLLAEALRQPSYAAARMHGRACMGAHAWARVGTCQLSRPCP